MTPAPLLQLLRAAEHHLNAGRPADAEAFARRALAADKRSPEAVHLLGLAALKQGRADEAVQHMRKSLVLRPDTPQFYSNLSQACCAAGDPARGADYARKAVELRPGDPMFLNNLSDAARQAGDLPTAVDAARRAVAARPDLWMGHANLGAALERTGDLPGARAAIERAVELEPRQPEAWANLAAMRELVGDLRGALAAHHRRMELTPDDPAARSALLMTSQYDPALTAAEVTRLHRDAGKHFADRVSAGTPPHPNDRDPDRRLRIGYVSGDLRDHAVARFFAGILESHDRARHGITLYSNSPVTDAVTDRLRAHGDHWEPLANRSDDDAATLVRSHAIDVLVDLGGHTRGGRLPLFARKPAPVQIAYLGYPGTTGLTSMDYVVADDVVAPPAHDDLYVERVLRLPHGFSCYRFLTDPPPVAPSPAAAAGRVTFASLHSLLRLNPEVIAAWSRILHAVPGSRLLVLRHDIDPSARNYLTAQFASHGIPAERLELRDTFDLATYLDVYQDADVLLDTFPWSGHTTACEALYMGAPVVTLLGNGHAGRMVASILHQVGLPDLVARDVDEYVRLATTLAADSGRLAALRAGLRTRVANSPLMDYPLVTRDLEAAYRQAWANWCHAG
jgi:predicted O-linked N-acetylglucosamine transferase (SPINDLY family)